jgi:hypothetical protein
MKHTDPIQSALDENKRERQAALRQLYINYDLTLLHEGDHARTRREDVIWLETTHAMSEAEAERAYELWLEVVA